MAAAPIAAACSDTEPMSGKRAGFLRIVEEYFSDLRKIRSSGGATPERSYYPPLINLLNAVGEQLKPKVFCISELAEQGAGHPDIGLYAARQVKRGQLHEGQLPECGVLEVKPTADDAWSTADGDQASRYWERYRLVLVTNTRDFLLIGQNVGGEPVKLELFRTAESASEFEALLQQPAGVRSRCRCGVG